MRDSYFGDITWRNHPGNGNWVTTVALPFFKGWGVGFHRWWAMPIGLQNELEEVEASTETESARTRPETSSLSEQEKLALEGILRLNIAPAGKPRGIAPPRPVEAQRQAWRRLLERENGIWEELLDRLFEEYREHRELRVRWWKATFGEHQLKVRYPAVSSKAELTDLIAPGGIYIKQVPGDAECTDIAMCFGATYGDFAVLIKSGKIAEFGTMSKLAFPVLGESPIVIEHPKCGRLRRHGAEAPWIGDVRCEAFQECCDIAETRATFRRSPDDVHRADMPLPWYFVQGDFRLQIAAASGEPPTNKQVQAVGAFKEGQARLAREIFEAAFMFYRLRHEQLRDALSDSLREDDIDACLPAPTDLEHFQELIGLIAVTVFPEDEKGDVPLGFYFASTWNPEGLGVRVEKGKVVTVGGRGVGDLPRSGLFRRLG